MLSRFLFCIIKLLNFEEMNGQMSERMNRSIPEIFNHPPKHQLVMVCDKHMINWMGNDSALIFRLGMGFRENVLLAFFAYTVMREKTIHRYAAPTNE
ncbi:MAG: hypothetical protein DWQ04_31990 [Chloroflexi bacterium]|nr:MAG: hypothetical protein DWQ04_31990 [Chloroflexota bacterium]